MLLLQQMKQVCSFSTLGIMKIFKQFYLLIFLQLISLLMQIVKSPASKPKSYRRSHSVFSISETTSPSQSCFSTILNRYESKKLIVQRLSDILKNKNSKKIIQPKYLSNSSRNLIPHQTESTLQTKIVTKEKEQNQKNKLKKKEHLKNISWNFHRRKFIVMKLESKQSFGSTNLSTESSDNIQLPAINRKKYEEMSARQVIYDGQEGILDEIVAKRFENIKRRTKNNISVLKTQ